MRAGRKQLFDEGQKRRIRGAYASGVSIRDLASRFHCNAQTIKNVLERKDETVQLSPDKSPELSGL